MDLQRSLLKTYRFFVITVLQHIDARSVHFFSFIYIKDCTIYRGEIFMDKTSQSGFTV